jgi:hypothetical protein
LLHRLFALIEHGAGVLIAALAAVLHRRHHVALLLIHLRALWIDAHHLIQHLLIVGVEMAVMKGRSR